jgi:hypothetical protein
MNGSGTTMLLDHLSSHSLLFGFPSETKSLPFFIEHQVEYGDLTDDRKFLKLWNDMKESVVGRVAPGPERIPTPENWREVPRTAASVFNQILLLFAGAKGKHIWCEKTPMHVHHLCLLAAEFPNAKFVHIVRDGRDCAASFHRRWKFNPVRTVYRWKRAVRAGRAQGQLLGSRYHEVRYEQVTETPEMAFRDICAFLGIAFEAAVLSAARSRPEMTGSSAQTVAPNQRRAAQYFGAADLARIEGVAGRYLTELGYVCRNPAGDSDPAPWALRWWEFTDDLRRFGVAMLAGDRMLRPRYWRYVVRRVRSALKQKATAKS